MQPKSRVLDGDGGRVRETKENNLLGYKKALTSNKHFKLWVKHFQHPKQNSVNCNCGWESLSVTVEERSQMTDVTVRSPARLDTLTRERV